MPTNTGSVQTSSASTIDEWLQSIGLGRFRELFVAQEIDAESLAEITEADLERWGVPFGPRKHLLRAIRARTGTPPPSASPPASDASSGARSRLSSATWSDRPRLPLRSTPRTCAPSSRAYNVTCRAAVEPLGGHVAQLHGRRRPRLLRLAAAHEDDPERAVHAGPDDHRDSTQRSRGPRPIPVQVRIGIATGLVVVGDLIGAGRSQEASIVGETPNLAARLQQVAAPGYRRDRARARAAGCWAAVRVAPPRADRSQGFRRPVDVLGGRRRGGGRKPLRGLRTAASLPDPLGRDAGACAAAATLGARAQRRGPDRAPVRASPASASRAWPRRSAPAVPPDAASAACATNARLTTPTAPLYPVSSSSSGRRGFGPATARAAKLSKLEPCSRVGWRPASDDPAARRSALHRRPTRRRSLTMLDPAMRKQHTLACWRELLASWRGSRPVLLLIEDAHWIDPRPMSCWARSPAAIRDSAMLVLVDLRPGTEADWSNYPRPRACSSTGLTGAPPPASSIRLPAARRCHRRCCDRILEKTDGVPLFIEELTKAVARDRLHSSTRRSPGSTAAARASTSRRRCRTRLWPDSTGCRTPSRWRRSAPYRPRVQLRGDRGGNAR